MARGPKGPGPKGMKPGMKIENPGKLFVRLMKYIFKRICHKSGNNVYSDTY